jgi:putative transposase
MLKTHRKRGFHSNAQSLSNTKWECKYHLTWIPKYSKKELYEDLRKYLGEVLRESVRRKECEILEAHPMPNHAQMLISIPPKYVVSQVVAFMKGKGAIHLGRGFFVEGRILLAEKRA